MSVPVPEADALDEPGLLDLTERFHDQHEADRGFCFRTSSRCCARRLVARATTPKPERLAPLGAVREAKAARRGRGVSTSALSSWDRVSWTRPSTTARCSPRRGGARARLVEEPFTVVVLPPGATARLDDSATTRSRFVACTCVPIYFDPESYATVESACERAHPAAEAPGRHRPRRRRLHRRAARCLCRRSARIWAGAAVLGSARPARRRSPSFCASRASRSSPGDADRRLAGHRRARGQRPGAGCSRNTATGSPPSPRLHTLAGDEQDARLDAITGVQAAGVRARVRGRVRCARVRRATATSPAGARSGFPVTCSPVATPTKK